MHATVEEHERLLRFVTVERMHLEKHERMVTGLDGGQGLDLDRRQGPAHERGLRIPEDLAVIAFDGTKESEFCWPPLTVVAQPIQEMARAAVRLVLDDARPTTYAQFAPTLLTRRSCGCAGTTG